MKIPDLKLGAEPDSCYYIQNEPIIRDKEVIIVGQDPPPDLVLEVDITNPSDRRIPIYALLGVPEVWRYDGYSLEFLALQDGEYIAIAKSISFPDLPAEIIVEYVKKRLVLGENGTGKSDLAQLIHQKSNRLDKPFVIVDLGAVPESLFESELFGHVKGAFTDAKEDRAGRFEEAHGGTLFLDEIGNLSLQMQAKLLTVLQNRTVTRVGSNKPRLVDVRIICATNQPIGQMVAERTFRQDLLYRINTIELRLPPLRERLEDIVPLAELFLKQYRHQYKRVVTTLSAALIKQLQRYNWPGNVRELRSAVERAVILTQQNTLQPEDFFQNAFTETSQFTETYQLEEMEKQLIVKAMKKYNGNITEVARELGLSRQALYRRMEKYEL
jgi:transcriptional regulator with PAS, ATPase and Fis domain